MAGFVRHAVGVVLVAREARPAPRPDGEQFRNQQPADPVMLLLAEDMLDLAMRFCVVGAILDKVGFAHVERLQNLVVFRAGDERLGLV